MSKLKAFFKDLPIERKIRVAILLTCCTALISSAAAVFLAQLVSFRQTFTGDLQAIGTMIGNSSTATLSFRDRKTAEEILAALKVKAHILQATIDLPEGGTLA